MGMKIKGEVVPRYEVNPFALNKESFQIGQKLQYIGDGNKFIAIIDKKTGEYQTKGAVIGFRKNVDQQEFIKIYTGGMAAIFNLSSAGKRIFSLVYKQVREQKGTDRVILQYQPNCGMSKPTWYKGIKECLANKLIAQSKVAGVYFTNITYFFNGSRLTLLKEYNIIQPEQADFEAEQNGIIEGQVLDKSNKSST